MGPGRPFGGSRSGLPQAFSENLPDLSGRVSTNSGALLLRGWQSASSSDGAARRRTSRAGVSVRHGLLPCRASEASMPTGACT